MKLYDGIRQDITVMCDKLQSLAARNEEVDVDILGDLLMDIKHVESKLFRLFRENSRIPLGEST